MQSATLCQHNHFLIYSLFAYLTSQSFATEMQSYSSSKPSSVVDSDWIYWSTSDYAQIDPHSDKIAALLFLTQK
jgi:hypothetical protein